MSALPPRSALALVLGAFFLTGATALASEVVLNRLLRYVFGTSHEATATVLAAYMCGLSLGAWGFGRLSARLQRPLRAYALLELGVALALALTVPAFETIRALGLTMARSLADAPLVYAAGRFALAFGLVLLPTFLMGGTLPVLLRALPGSELLTRRLPTLYAVNTLGAAVGTVAAAYVLLPTLGLDGTLALCAVVDLAVALGALVLSGRFEGPAGAPEPVAVAVAAPAPRVMLSALAAAQGFLFFSLEVVWTHLVGTVIGVTVYAFALMLTAILLGLAIGSALLPLLARWSRLPPLPLYVACLAALAAGVLVSLPAWDRFPDVVAASRAWSPEWNFAGREWVRFLFVLAVVGPASTAAGAGLPSLIAAGGAGLPERQAGSWTGRVLAANTLGAVAGAWVTGFLWIGRVPAEALLRGLGLGAALLAALALLRASGRPGRARATALVALAALVAVALPRWDASRLTHGAHYYWTARERREPIVFLEEDPQVGFVTVRARGPVLVMETNGKYEGSSAPTEFQDLLGLIGALHAPRSGRALVIGIGPGRVLSGLLEQGFGEVVAVEYSAAVLRAAALHFPDYGGAALRDPRVRVLREDGRHALETSRGGHDLVVTAITGAAFAGAGSLYTHEFFAAVRDRLAPDGVMVHWLQLHHVRAGDVRSVLATVRGAFPHVAMYVQPRGAQGYIVASRAPLAVRRERALVVDAGDKAMHVLQATRLQSSLELLSWIGLGSDAELQAYLGPPPRRIFSDLNPAFEYATPLGLTDAIVGHDFAPWWRGGYPDVQPPLAEHERLGLLGLKLLAWGRDVPATEALAAADRLEGGSRWRARLLQRAPADPAPPAQPR